MPGSNPQADSPEHKVSGVAAVWSHVADLKKFREIVVDYSQRICFKHRSRLAEQSNITVSTPMQVAANKASLTKNSSVETISNNYIIGPINILPNNITPTSSFAMIEQVMSLYHDLSNPHYCGIRLHLKLLNNYMRFTQTEERLEVWQLFMSITQT